MIGKIRAVVCHKSVAVQVAGSLRFRRPHRPRTYFEFGGNISVRLFRLFVFDSLQGCVAGRGTVLSGRCKFLGQGSCQLTCIGV